MSGSRDERPEHLQLPSGKERLADLKRQFLESQGITPTPASTEAVEPEVPPSTRISRVHADENAPPDPTGLAPTRTISTDPKIGPKLVPNSVPQLNRDGPQGAKVGYNFHLSLIVSSFALVICVGVVAYLIFEPKKPKPASSEDLKGALIRIEKLEKWKEDSEKFYAALGRRVAVIEGQVAMLTDTTKPNEVKGTDIINRLNELGNWVRSEINRLDQNKADR